MEKKVFKKFNDEIEYEAYVLDGYRVLSDIDETGGAKKSYVWGNGIDELIATAKGNGGKFDYYLSNHLGSITQITNDKAEVQESYTYSVYGKLTVYDKKGKPKSGAGTNKPAKPKVRYTYTGREWDPETLLYYYRARWYSPTMGRVISRDPIYSNDIFNLYFYVQNNPTNYIDPTGCIKEIVKLISRKIVPIIKIPSCAACAARSLKIEFLVCNLDIGCICHQFKNDLVLKISCSACFSPVALKWIPADLIGCK